MLNEFKRKKKKRIIWNMFCKLRTQLQWDCSQTDWRKAFRKRSTWFLLTFTLPNFWHSPRKKNPKLKIFSLIKIHVNTSSGTQSPGWIHPLQCFNTVKLGLKVFKELCLYGVLHDLTQTALSKHEPSDYSTNNTNYPLCIFFLNFYNS